EMDDRTGLSRRQRPQIRHGHERIADFRPAKARPPAASERPGGRLAHPARRCRREPRSGSASEVQHRQTPNPFAIPTGMPALRSHPQHARTQATALIVKYAELLSHNSAFTETFGLV